MTEANGFIVLEVETYVDLVGDDNAGIETPGSDAYAILTIDEDTAVADPASDADAIFTVVEDAGVVDPASDVDTVLTVNEHAGVADPACDVDTILMPMFADRTGLAMWIVPHWLTKNRKLPKVRSIPECTCANADRSEAECGAMEP